MSTIAFHSDILVLLHRQVKGEELSLKEQASLAEWLALSAHNQALMEWVRNDEAMLTSLVERYALDRQQAWEKVEAGMVALSAGEAKAADKNIMTEEGTAKSGARIAFLRRWRWVAAAVLLLAVTGVFLWRTRLQHTPPPEVLTNIEQDRAPGGNRAMLTLADGSTILLDSIANGQIAQQGNSRIYKQADGQIRYLQQGHAGTSAMINTMRTPPGGQYQLVLPDGTRVWLNAASSISYPSAFTGTQRTIKMTGEAYFEVVTDNQRPFVVEADNRLAVEVLGTRFNVNSYDNEPGLRTTLLQGRVQLRALTGGHPQNDQLVLRPGQQGVLNAGNGQRLKISELADIESALAWKNGYFNLRDAGFDALMRELERWYDIRVEYKSTIPAIELKGKMDRGVHLSGVLRLLAELGVKGSLNGKVLTID